MPEPTLRVQPLAEHHQIDAFSCGVPSLDHWLYRSARAVAAKHVGRTYVCTGEHTDDAVLAYFTLAPHAVRRHEAPGAVGRGSPETIPAILLARLALSRDLHGRGLGGTVLVSAFDRALDAIAIAGGRLIVVDAIDEPAAGFYEHYGFRRLPGHQRLYRKATDIAQDLGRNSKTLTTARRTPR